LPKWWLTFTEIISGITFIAYKHPTAYEKIYGNLIILIIVIFLGFAIWDIAIQTAEPLILKFVQPNKQNIAKNSLNELRVNGVYLLAICGGVGLYLFFISLFKYYLKPE